MDIKPQNISLYYYILDCRDTIKLNQYILDIPISEDELLEAGIYTPVNSLTVKEINNMIDLATKVRKEEVKHLKE